MFCRNSILVALIAGLFGSPALADPPLKVVASFSILGDMVREIGGDKVSVTVLVGPDGDAHVYQPTPADAKSLIAADLVVINGLGFESWFDRLKKATASKAPVIVASEGVTPQSMEEEGHGKMTDPHAWQNLANGRLYVANIAKALAAASPQNAAFFAANADAYAKRLMDLDVWVRNEFDAIPSDQRKIITSHDAFGYFAKAYGWEFIAPVGLSTDAEPTPKGIAALIRQMKSEQVKAVFFENMVDPRLVRQIAKDSGGIVGGTLYADALSGPSGPASTYELMFRHNVTTLKDALIQ